MTHTRSKPPNLADQHEVDIIDVAIVGGGPGGLSTAAAVLSAFGNAFRVKVRFLMFCQEHDIDSHDGSRRHLQLT